MKVAALLAGVVAVATGLLFHVAADGGGVWSDSTVNRYQAKLMASGCVSVSEPPVSLAVSFRVPGSTYYRGRWFGKYYPVFPVLLAFGEAAGAPWIVNPILAGTLVLGTFLLGRRVASPGVGLAAASLLSLSPLLWNLASTYLNHVTCATALVFSAVVFLRARERAGFTLGLVAGLLWAAALLTRPFTAVCALLPFAALGLQGNVLGRNRRAVRPNAGFAVGVLTGIAGMLLWNASLTGDPFISAYQISKPRDGLGFIDVETNSERYAGPYTPAQALGTLRDQLRAAAVTVFPVPFPGIAGAALAAPFLAVLTPPPVRGRAIVLALVPLLLITGHFFYPGTRASPATALGPRFYFESLPAYFVLLGLGARQIVESRPRLRALALSALAVLALLASIRVYPGTWSSLHESHANRPSGQSRSFEKFVEALPPGRRLLFVDVSTYNRHSVLIANRPDLSDENLVAIYRQPEENRAVLDAYPGRKAFLVRWKAATDTPTMLPYVPEEDRVGGLHRFPYLQSGKPQSPPLDDSES